jgi:hypothetical protein
MFWAGLAAALGYGLVWTWVRKEIREQYRREITAAELVAKSGNQPTTIPIRRG